MSDPSIIKLSKDMPGKNVAGWVIEEYVNCGNSGAVFRAKNTAGQTAAIKIISEEIIQRYGKDEQIKRIDREKLIIGHSHPNLIQIFDGGVCRIENSEHLFIAMEFLEQRNLKEVNNQILLPMIPNIICQLASACRYLESKSIAHRDIKLENIVIDPMLQTIKLLDLGVLRPILQEGEYPRNKDFIATLRASPPELMERREGESLEDWRAITFYQIGVVIYELLSKKPIFEKQSEPKSALILAVKSAYPSFEDILRQDGLSNKALVQLCKKCLRKEPSQRTSILTWDTFEGMLGDTMATGLEEKACLLKQISKRDRNIKQLEFETAKKTDEICKTLKESIRRLCQNNPSNCLYPLVISNESISTSKFTLKITLSEIQESVAFSFSVNFDLNTLSAFRVSSGQEMFIYDDEIGSEDLNNEIINALLLHFIENMPDEETKA